MARLLRSDLQLLTYNRDFTQNPVLRLKAYNGLIYNRACQEHFSPCTRCAGLVRDILTRAGEPTLLWNQITLI